MNKINHTELNLQYRIGLLSRLGKYLLSDDPEWQKTKGKASAENAWFIPGFIDTAVKNIANSFLDKTLLEQWVTPYCLPEINETPKSVGIVMAGNIPLVGFHDLMSVFISGNRAIIKTSSKDNVLIRHLAEKMNEWEAQTSSMICFEEMLKGCDAYIATGSNNSSRYFNFYFGKYPHIIRRNKTSVAVLTGKETTGDLEKLADDVFLYFGLGCRNITKIYVPEDYDFITLLDVFKKYDYLADHHKYKNNYDYNLTLHILNNKFYMTNSSVLLSENNSFFSPISQLNYEYYTEREKVNSLLTGHADIQSITGEGFTNFGQSQCPGINDYADGIDTMQFLSKF